MRLALVQMDLAWEDVAENHRRARKHLEEAARQGARLALLPEMFCTGFSMESDKIAQPPGGPSETFLRATAKELGLSILASIPEAGRRELKRVQTRPAMVDRIGVDAAGSPEIASPGRTSRGTRPSPASGNESVSVAMSRRPTTATSAAAKLCAWGR